MIALKFSNGDTMPALGLGTYRIPNRKAGNVITTALDVGYRHIDCAFYYHNEKSIGAALQQYLSKNEVRREDLWVTSKLWNNAHKSEDVLPALKRSLQDLQLDYLDLYMIHWPVAFKPEVKTVPQSLNDYLTLEDVPILETWEAMREAQKQGLIKHLGVSNFSFEKLRALVENTDAPPEVLQVEAHPFLPQQELLKYCKEQGLHFTAYSPLGRGKRGEEGVPSLFEDPLIHEMAQKYSCSVAQVLIAWGLQRGTSVIPKASSPEHIKSNFESQNIQFDVQDKQRLNSISTHHRYGWGNSFLLPGSPYENIFGQ